MWYLDAVSKTTELSLFVSRANHSISQLSKSMPQPVTLKKLKLNGFMKTYRTFRTPKKDVLFIIATLMGMKWYFIVVLIYVFS